MLKYLNDVIMGRLKFSPESFYLFFFFFILEILFLPPFSVQHAKYNGKSEEFDEWRVHEEQTLACGSGWKREACEDRCARGTA